MGTASRVRIRSARTVDAFERNQRRSACRKCGATAGIEEKDGSKCDEMPGVTYRVCNNWDMQHRRQEPAKKG